MVLKYQIPLHNINVLNDLLHLLYLYLLKEHNNHLQILESLLMKDELDLFRVAKTSSRLYSERIIFLTTIIS